MVSFMQPLDSLSFVQLKTKVNHNYINVGFLLRTLYMSSYTSTQLQLRTAKGPLRKEYKKNNEVRLITRMDRLTLWRFLSFYQNISSMKRTA